MLVSSSDVLLQRYDTLPSVTILAHVWIFNDIPLGVVSFPFSFFSVVGSPSCLFPQYRGSSGK